jgi:malonyl-CoA O-methyltransferase
MHRNPTANDRRALTAAEQSRAVAASFDRAAADYDRHARVQKQAAKSLAARILENAPVDPRRILELGCGTGFLTEQLISAYRGADWTITDISPQMVERCRQKLQARESTSRQSKGQRVFRVMDAQSIDVTDKFDLICSNLTFQWFPDLLPVVIDLTDRLNPGGVLVFNTLGLDSFSYWKILDQQVGGEPSATEFPSFVSIANGLFDGCRDRFGNGLEIEAEAELLCDQHATFLEFLQSLKTIGAGTPVSSRLVSTAQLRSVLRRSQQNDPQGVTIEYQVITVVIRRRHDR